MRVLCTCLPGYGHFLPMLPLGRALVAAGHEVAFASAAEFCPQMEKEGFISFAAGLSLPEQLATAARMFPEQSAMPHGLDRFQTFVPRMLAGAAAPPRADALVPLVRAWQPDVLVHDETDFGGPVAAAVAGIPYADHSVGSLRPLGMARLARDTITPLWERWDVDLGAYGGLFRYLYLDVAPPSLQSPEIAGIDVAYPMQNAHIAMGDSQAPPWLAELPAVPTVYVTLGTIFNQSPEIFQTVLSALGDQACNVIVTVGADNDPAALGEQPAHVRVERFIPQEALLPYCDVVVNQGGTAILPILAHGLPMLLLPQGANQFLNAAACVRAGVARSLEPAAVTIDAVRDGVRTLLDDAQYRERSQGVAREIAMMPGPDAGVRLLERLARERRPLTRAAVPS